MAKIIYGDIKMMFLFGLVLDPLLGTLTIFLGSLFALPMSLYLMKKNNTNKFSKNYWHLIKKDIKYFQTKVLEVFYYAIYTTY